MGPIAGADYNDVGDMIQQEIPHRQPNLRMHNTTQLVEKTYSMRAYAVLN